MAYDQKEIFKQAKEAIDKNKLVFIADIVAYLPISKETFYQYFPIDSDEYDHIKGMMNKNKITLKVSMRKKWFDSDAPALQIGLMKLLSTDEELKKLSMHYNDITTKGESINATPLTPAEAKAKLEQIKNDI